MAVHWMNWAESVRQMVQEYFQIAFVSVESRSIPKKIVVLPWIKVFVQKELQVSMIPFGYKENEIINVKLWIKVFDLTHKKNCVDLKENLIVLVKPTECSSKENMKHLIFPILLAEKQREYKMKSWLTSFVLKGNAH